MSNVFEKIQVGFNTKGKPTDGRMVNKDGSFNVLHAHQPFNLYHRMVSMSLIGFLCVIFLAYISINLLFGIAYWQIGVEHIQQTPLNAGHDFLLSFYFSTQAFTTVGYGGMHTTGNAAQSVAAFESFTGLICFAIATGLLYGRFSKPSSSIIFSANALISPYKKKKAIMFRVANQRNSRVTNVNIRVLYSFYAKNEAGQMTRQIKQLDLETQSIFFLAISWTVVHPIDAKSPFHKKTFQQIQEEGGEIFALLDGFDETYSSNINARTSYVLKNEIIDNAKFELTYTTNKLGYLIFDLHKLNAYKLLG